MTIKTAISYLERTPLSLVSRCWNNRAAALETYMRRVYRAHKILDISVNADGDEMTVDWSCRFRDTDPNDSPVSLTIRDVCRLFNVFLFFRTDEKDRSRHAGLFESYLLWLMFALSFSHRAMRCGTSSVPPTVFAVPGSGRSTNVLGALFS